MKVTSKTSTLEQENLIEDLTTTFALVIDLVFESIT